VCVCGWVGGEGRAWNQGTSIREGDRIAHHTTTWGGCRHADQPEKQMLWWSAVSTAKPLGPMADTEERGWGAVRACGASAVPSETPKLSTSVLLHIEQARECMRLLQMVQARYPQQALTP